MRTLTKEMLAHLSPEQAIQLLKDGNQRFVSNLKLNRNLLQQVNETSEGQFPFALVLSCIDSRTSAELIFDQGLGDIFSCRIAGNILNEDILGSMEFACRIAGSKVIMILGHTKCGAVKGACHGIKLGNLTALLDKLQPVMDAELSGKAISDTPDLEFMENIARLNVRYVMEEIPKRSPVIAEMLDNREIALEGGMYDVDTGMVTFYDK
ncbi:carbonic anhydrase family protein [uncultured Nitrosomonas sp.]|uniref:carbonic anhydrase family protein n=1 Tax=uncultured Nitrosomonas sp. TaxID=156424 RepID=UPI002621A726|nr:carbonic anhydrase family protein [uncultured Nitrosomonas sp.]